MHDAAFDYIEAAVEQYGPWQSVAEFGARNINGSVRYLFDKAERYIGVDVVSGLDVDVVADAATWDPDVRFDCVVCAEVLEHTEAAPRVVANAARLLNPGGVFIMTCAGVGRKPHSAVDGLEIRDDEFYRNVGEATLNRWLAIADFSEWTIDTTDEDIRCVAWR
jgi:SAM-dependent methyltransferase